MAALRALVGGEIKEYTETMAKAKQLAMERMIAEAHALGADALLRVRFSTSMAMSGAAEISIWNSHQI